MADKPLVWICTPLREFEHNGVLTKEAFESLADHYKNPIKELCSHPDLPWRVDLNITGGGNVFQARNRFATDFVMKGGSPDDRLLMVDYDLMPTAQDYSDILCRDIPIIGTVHDAPRERPLGVKQVAGGGADRGRATAGDGAWDRLQVLQAVGV